MEKKVILTDLDGTLLRSNATISNYSISILTEAIKREHIISYATARSYISSNKIVSAIPWKYPLVLYNGAMLFNPLSEKMVDGYWLNRDIANEIIRLGKEVDLTPFLFLLDHNHDERVLHPKLIRPGNIHFYRSRPNDPRFKEVEPLNCPDGYKTLIVTYIGLYDELEYLRQIIIHTYGDHVHIHFMKDQYIENHYFLEFSHPKANKREGLLLWAEYMNCEPDQIIVFGDNTNDIGLFDAAGTKIAVSNAHEQLKAMADIIIGSNDEDSVAKYMEYTFLT